MVTTEHAAQAFQALGSEPRIHVLSCLVRAGEGGLLVKDVQARTRIAASTLSHHLRCLAQAGLIDQTRSGREIVVRPNFNQLRAISSFILDQCCADECAAGSQALATLPTTPGSAGKPGPGRMATAEQKHKPGSPALVDGDVS